MNWQKHPIFFTIFFTTTFLFIFPGFIPINSLGNSLFAENLDNYAKQIAKRFSSEINCTSRSKSPHRTWCPIVRIPWAKFKTPSGIKSYIGLSMELKTNARVVPSLLNATNPAVLHLNYGRVRVTYLNPSDAKEGRELSRIVFMVARIIKGYDKLRVVSVTNNLFGFLQSQSRKRGYFVRTGRGGGHYQGKLPAIIYSLRDRRAGKIYVVIEKSKKGAFVNIFPITKIRRR